MAAEPNLQDYQAALTGVVFFPQPRAGYLRLQGADRLAFLQRQTTNDVTHLSPRRSILTVLVNPAARILDVLRLIPETEEAIGVLTLPGTAGETARFLKSRIFFKDQVTLIDASAQLAQVDLEGPAAAALLRKLGLPEMPEVDQVISGEIDGVGIICIGQPGFAGVGLRLLAPAAGRKKLEAALSSNGAGLLSEASFHILRVENGLPAAGFELTGSYTPLETGLQAAISSSKGCYTGQEVIARQTNYDKVTQHLVGLRLQATGLAGERVWAEGRLVGSLTTAVHSPRLGPVALAIIKRPYHQSATGVIIGGDGKVGGTPAVVVGLPFALPDKT